MEGSLSLEEFVNFFKLESFLVVDRFVLADIFLSEVARMMSFICSSPYFFFLLEIRYMLELSFINFIYIIALTY